MMLLYDRVREHAEHTLRRCGPEAFGRSNCSELLALRSAVVYEVSAITPLFGDWQREREKAVPKRPPFPFTWVEWAYADCPEGRTDCGDWWRLAALVGPLPPERRRQLAGIRLLSDSGLPPPEFFAADKDFYCVRMFKLLERSVPAGASPGRRGAPPDLGLPSCDCTFFAWSQLADGTGTHRYRVFPQPAPGESKEEFLRRASVFFMPVTVSFGFSPYWQCADPWPAFLAFAFLHCRNVVTEDHVPDERLQRRVRRAGNPPRVTYKTLHLEVPRSVFDRRSYDHAAGSEDGPKVRFHLCSGHFRELRSERFTAKRGQWVWVPAHWRGCKDLGEVSKTYQVEGAR